MPFAWKPGGIYQSGYLVIRRMEENKREIKHSNKQLNSIINFQTGQTEAHIK